MEFDVIHEVGLDRLRGWSAFNNIIWPEMEGEPITKEEIFQAILDGDLVSEPMEETRNALISGARTRRYHVARVAWLVLNIDSNPIDIDIGVPALGMHVDWPVTDGNHRLAAAFYRGDESILAFVSGDIEIARELFNI
jgi:hypothetical protein